MINERQARKFCKEDLSKIKNYAKAIADTTQVWDCHHMTETWWNCSKQELIDNECYYNRKACELIFLTRAEHNRLHNKGKTVTDETRRKLSETLKGHTVSEETRRKMSEAKKGRARSDETRRKISESLKGENNPFFGQHHSEESRKKMSEAKKGKHSTEETKQKISEARMRYLAKKRGEI